MCVCLCECVHTICMYLYGFMHVSHTAILLGTAAHVRPQFYLKQMECNIATQAPSGCSGLYTQQYPATAVQRGLRGDKLRHQSTESGSKFQVH